MRLEANKVSFRYSKKQPWVFEEKNFSIASGEKIAILAPSGYGKSTLAMLLAGHFQPDYGTVRLNEKPLPTKGVSPVQLIFQHPEKAINPRWRMGQVLAESGALREDLLSNLGIQKAWLDRFPLELSGGELQRFCVARALQSGADFLICDEISTMLDVITQAQIWNTILAEARNHNMGLVIVTHNYELARKVADQICDISL